VHYDTLITFITNFSPNSIWLDTTRYPANLVSNVSKDASTCVEDCLCHIVSYTYCLLFGFVRIPSVCAWAQNTKLVQAMTIASSSTILEPARHDITSRVVSSKVEFVLYLLKPASTVPSFGWWCPASAAAGALTTVLPAERRSTSALSREVLLAEPTLQPHCRHVVPSCNTTHTSGGHFQRETCENAVPIVEKLPEHMVMSLVFKNALRTALRTTAVFCTYNLKIFQREGATLSRTNPQHGLKRPAPPHLPLPDAWTQTDRLQFPLGVPTVPVLRNEHCTPVAV